jgi:uncharacterized membrane protein
MRAGMGKGQEMVRRTTLAVTAATILALGANSALAGAASSGANGGTPPDQGNCFGNFVNAGSQGSNVSNGDPGDGRASGLGQSIGKDEHGCRG